MAASVKDSTEEITIEEINIEEIIIEKVIIEEVKEVRLSIIKGIREAMPGVEEFVGKFNKAKLLF